MVDRSGPCDYDDEVRLHDEVLRQAYGIQPREHVLDIGCGLGYDWHNVMHMIMGPVSEAVYQTLAEKQPFDRADYVRRLAELPGDWPPPEKLGLP